MTEIRIELPEEEHRLAENLAKVLNAWGFLRSPDLGELFRMALESLSNRVVMEIERKRARR